MPCKISKKLTVGSYESLEVNSNWSYALGRFLEGKMETEMCNKVEVIVLSIFVRHQGKKNNHKRNAALFPPRIKMLYDVLDDLCIKYNSRFRSYSSKQDH